MIVWDVKTKLTTPLQTIPASGQTSLEASGVLFGPGCPIKNHHLCWINYLPLNPGAKSWCNEAKQNGANEINNIIKITHSRVTGCRADCAHGPIAQHVKGLLQEHVWAMNGSQKPTWHQTAQVGFSWTAQGDCMGTALAWKIRIGLDGWH